LSFTLKTNLRMFNPSNTQSEGSDNPVSNLVPKLKSIAVPFRSRPKKNMHSIDLAGVKKPPYMKRRLSKQAPSMSPSRNLNKKRGKLIGSSMAIQQYSPKRRKFIGSVAESLDKVIHRRRMTDIKFMSDGRIDYTFEHPEENPNLFDVDKPVVTKRKIRKDTRQHKVKQLIRELLPKSSTFYDDSIKKENREMKEQSLHKLIQDRDDIVEFYKAHSHEKIYRNDHNDEVSNNITN